MESHSEQRHRLRIDVETSRPLLKSNKVDAEIRVPRGAETVVRIGLREGCHNSSYATVASLGVRNQPEVVVSTPGVW